MIGLLSGLLLAQFPLEGAAPYDPYLGIVLTYRSNPAAQTCLSSPVGTMLEPFTFTRGTAAFNDFGSDVPSSITSCASGNQRLNSRGYLAEPQTFNEVIQSQTMDNVAWTTTTATVTANTTTAPDATVTAETVTSTSNGGLITAAAVTSANSIYTASVYVKVASGSQTFDLVYFDNTATTTRCSVTGAVATTQWQRFQCTDSTAVTVSHSILWRLYPGTASSTGTVIAWGAQLEVANYATTYVPTTTVRLAHNTDVGYFDLPGRLTTTELGSGYGWCIVTDYIPPPPTNAYTVANLTQGLWEISSGTHNTANNAQAYIKAGGNSSFDIRDTSNTLRTFNTATPSAGSHRFGWCVDETGTGATLGVTAYVDGVSVSITSNTGTGTAIQSAMGTRLYWGILTSSSTVCGTVDNLTVARFHTVGAKL